ncbi:glycosyltransferase family 2 protein [Campylobacter ureolyticus]|uniref:glycosyltransferase family 2 protein n=1 Tax=Campylobacter ureolyticus TaxID=827 RepID=UPI002914748A|nr:glycosyltransferase family 2 protein [Campylobacter ureolyticus]MDU5325880.1 glycosyltransferase family 2 protein [Campylobacter ureolyticus]
MIKASVYIITLNEEKHIRRTLESVKNFDEIIVVDSGSSDKTLEIAKEYTKNIFYKKWEGEGIQKNYALSLCKNEWVLSLDADEEISCELNNEIKNFIMQDNFLALDIKFLEYYMGVVSSNLVKKNTHIRFFKKTNGVYNTKGVHAQITIKDGLVKKSKFCIHHFSDKFIHEFVMKNNNYSTLRANENKNKGRKFSLIKLIFIFPLMFFKFYILRRNIFNGIRGFILAIVIAFYAFLKEAKLYELCLKEKSQI